MYTVYEYGHFPLEHKVVHTEKPDKKYYDISSYEETDWKR
jgi:hypothetical protein